jgi:hypothetical protein
MFETTQWLALAKRAGIPNEQSSQQNFLGGLYEAIRHAWRGSVTIAVRSHETASKLERIASHARELHKVLAPLIKRPDELRTIAYLLPRNGEDLVILAESMSALADDSERAAAAVKPHARPPETNFLNLRPIVKYIDSAVAAGNGRRLTFNKNTKKGTLVDFLDMLSAHLPPGFLPSNYKDMLYKLEKARAVMEDK